LHTQIKDLHIREKIIHEPSDLNRDLENEDLLAYHGVYKFRDHEDDDFDALFGSLSLKIMSKLLVLLLLLSSSFFYMSGNLRCYYP
jgi:predicted ATP-binding protein involved in virulence